MGDYETNPMAGDMNDGEVNRPTVIWPDAALYCGDHVKLLAPRVHESWRSEEKLVVRAVLCVLTDLPHELVHCLQASTFSGPILEQRDSLIDIRSISNCFINLNRAGIVLARPTVNCGQQSTMRAPLP